MFEANIRDYKLYLNGIRITLDELVEPKQKREHSYLFEGVGDSWADYYLETEDSGDLLASTLDGAVIEPDFHWISEDGTKVTARIDPGQKHAYEFDKLLLDVTVDGEANAFLDGEPSDLDSYPLPGATNVGNDRDDAWWTPYANDGVVVDADGLYTAVQDYLQGELPSSWLNRLVNSYLSGQPVISG